MKSISNSDWKKVLDAIPAKEIKKLNIPAHIYAQEAENMYHWCQKDKKSLVAAGLDWTMVDSIPTRIDMFRQCQSLWMKEWNDVKDARLEWKLKSPEAYGLRNQLLHAFRYAFRKNTSLLVKTARITEGGSHSDMLQDLSDLTILGQANTKLLESIKFDLTLLDKALAMSSSMADLLAAAQGDQRANSTSRLVRDKAFTHLKIAIEEVRDCGKYVFWQDEERLKGYFSRYHKNKPSRRPVDTDLQDAA